MRHYFREQLTIVDCFAEVAIGQTKILRGQHCYHCFAMDSMYLLKVMVVEEFVETNQILWFIIEWYCQLQMLSALLVAD